MNEILFCIEKSSSCYVIASVKAVALNKMKLDDHVYETQSHNLQGNRELF